MFAQNRASVLACLRRMCLDASATLRFENSDDTLRFEVHVDDDEAEEEGSEFIDVHVVVHVFPPWMSDEQGYDRVIEQVLINEFGPDYDDDVGGFHVDTLMFQRVACTDDVARLVDTINRVHRWAVCPCARRLIFDEAPMCLLCQVAAPDGGDEILEDACITCLQDCLAMHVSRTPCCGKVLHRLCARRHGQNHARCPACRKLPSGSSSSSSSE